MEVWKDVKAGRNTNKNKLIIKKPAYIQLSGMTHPHPSPNTTTIKRRWLVALKQNN